jgi:hypothetical protein
VSRERENEGIRKFIAPCEALRKDLQVAVDRQRAAGDLEPLRDLALATSSGVRS